MTFNKKILIVLLMFFSVAIMAVPRFASADQGLWDKAQEGGLDKIGSETYKSDSAPTDIREIVAKLINIFLSILGIIFLSMILYAGFIYMTSQGEEEKIEKAVSQIKTGVIGLVIILAAYGISIFVTNSIYTATK